MSGATHPTLLLAGDRFVLNRLLAAELALRRLAAVCPDLAPGP